MQCPGCRRGNDIGSFEHAPGLGRSWPAQVLWRKLSGMGDVVNLNRFRKRKREEEERRQADRNALQYGRNRAERRRLDHERDKAERRLDGARLERGDAAEDADGDE